MCGAGIQSNSVYIASSHCHLTVGHAEIIYMLVFSNKEIIASLSELPTGMTALRMCVSMLACLA